MVTFVIIVIIVVELGLITPPIGINVFTVKSVIPDVALTQIFVGVMPFVIADLVVFNPQTIIDDATYEQPHQLSQGIQHLLVNGVPVIADGSHTQARAGRVLRRGG